MSTTPDRTPATSELEQLTARLDELQRHTEGLTAALENSRTTRRLIMLAFLAFVVVSLWQFYALGNQLRSAEYQNRLMAELQKSLDGNQKSFQAEGEKLVKAVTPVVTTAFSEQSKKDMPVFMQIIDRERTTLLESLATRMSEKLEDHHHKLLSRHDKLFQEEFPSVQNPEIRDRMMGNTLLALDRLVKKYYVDELKKELQSMDRAWEDFPPADKAGEGDPPLESQLVGELMDLLAIKFSRSRPAAN